MKTLNALVFILTIIFINTGVHTNLLGQTYTSRSDAANASWTNNSTWVGTRPSNILTGAKTVNINGYVTLSNNLEITNTSRVYINDILWVTGNIKMSGDSYLEIGPNGYLIVSGSIELSNRASLVNKGLIVTNGKLEMKDQSRVDNSASKAAFFSDNNAVTNGNYQGDSVQSKNDLQNADPALYDFVYNNGTRPLPIELLYFRAEAAGSAISLNWATATEDNFDYFTLERAGEEGDFEAIAEIKGVGFSTEEVSYHFSDEHPLPGLNLYRLKATDLDGVVEYHHIVSAWVTEQRQERISVYPNPLVGNEILHISSSSMESQQISISDLSGNTIVQTTLTGSIHQIQLPEGLKRGYYLVSVTKPDGARQHIRLLRQ